MFRSVNIGGVRVEVCACPPWNDDEDDGPGIDICDGPAVG